jgi:hypothetical protein
VSEGEKVPLIVVEGEAPAGPAAGDGEEVFTPHLRILPGKVGKLKEVDYDRLKRELEKVQAQMGGVFASLDKARPSGKFSLSEVAVSLAVSGEGSVGIATVGAEATITLTYSRSS